MAPRPVSSARVEEDASDTITSDRSERERVHAAMTIMRVLGYSYISIDDVLLLHVNIRDPEN